MKLVSRIEVNSQSREVLARGDNFANALALTMAHEGAREARVNVAPGRGPGPHPHKPISDHLDTGELMRSIEVVAEERGFLKTANITTDLEYGLYLEVGWVNPWTGNFWRYPWLWPAVLLVQTKAAAMARSTARQYFIDDAGRRVNAAGS